MAWFEKDSDAEDMFADTRMTFGEHLEDLRKHLWKALYGFFIAMIFSFIFLGKPALEFIAHPVEKQLAEFYANRAKNVEAELDAGDTRLEALNRPINLEMSFDRRKLAGLLLPPADAERVTAEGPERITLDATIEQPLRLAIPLQKAQFEVGRKPGLGTLSIQEAFMAWAKLSLACGFILGSPWIFYQVWLFIAAGLYPHEKRLVNVYLPFSLSLFLAGVLVCEFLVIPKAIQALLWFNEWLGLEPDLRFNEWLGFAILMPLIFGISFQLPLGMMFLDRIGIFSPKTYIRQWRWACLIIHIIAAVVIPTGDIVSMEGLAIPLFALYGLGILLCRLNPRPDESGLEDVEMPEGGDLVV